MKPLFKLVKSKASGRKKFARDPEKFVKKHSHHIEHAAIADAHALDLRRVVWVSLHGLFYSWKRCPMLLLYTSIIIAPLKRKWIYHPAKYQAELSEKVATCPEFIELLQWKDSQKLIFFLGDLEQSDRDREEAGTLIAPFWVRFSNVLTSLYDHVTHSNYQPLPLDANYWRNCQEFKFVGNRISVLSELYFVSKKFKAIQEIIYHSNPGSLNPVIFYADDKRFVRVNEPALRVRIPLSSHSNSPTEPEEAVQSTFDEHDDGWFIAADYDE
eukprot:CAMPEP_0197031872 /NCGR_PEP_ID=MMETSP1384-20130603/10716_1 /TAXON_ID=29189 /ORGANISM="Ammonia sp." /LENGTH=269 /DNA_ID=CAMNT_0042461449 /DNA_START=55 /DNA_END=864 /DNA_ORIENTATION=-